MTNSNPEPATEIEARLRNLERLLSEVRNLVGPFGTVFPDGTMLVQTIHGNKYFIDPSDEIMAPQLVIYRQWEADVSRFLIGSVTPDSIFVDVGANFGYFTCLAASKIGTKGSGRVIALEPNPAMERLLRKNTRINWSTAPIMVHACAAAAASGTVELKVPTGRAANASIRRGSDREACEVFTVACRTLDEIVGQQSIDLMKIDVEGFEAEVLKGATATIRTSPNLQIVMEWSLKQMADAGYSADDLLAIFSQLGLSAYGLPDNRFVNETRWQSLAIGVDALRATTYGNLVLRRS